MFRTAIVLGLAVTSFSGAVPCVQSISLPSYLDDGLRGGRSLGPDFGHKYKELQIQSDLTGGLINDRPFGVTPQAIRVDNKLQTIRVTLTKTGYRGTTGYLDLTTFPDLSRVIHEDLMQQTLRGSRVSIVAVNA